MGVPESNHEMVSTPEPDLDVAPELVSPMSPALKNGALHESQDKQKAWEKAFEEVSKSEPQLLHIIDAIPALAWSYRADGSNEFQNQRWLDYTGIRREAARGEGWKISIHPEDLRGFMANWETLLLHRTAGECEARLRRSDGVFLWFLFRIEPIRDENGQVARWFGTATDIDDRKRNESLHAAEKRILEMIANGAGLSEVLNDLCDAIDTHAPGATSFVCVMDSDEKQLQPRAGPRVPAAFTKAITPFPIGPDRGSCGTAAFTKQRVIIPDISRDPKWPGDLRNVALEHGVCAAWSEPLISKDGEVLGTFCVSYGEPRNPDSRDIELIEAAGNIARIAIERERSQEALRRAFDEIRQSESTLRQTINTIPTLAWCNLPDGSNEFLNQRWHDYTGLSPQEAHGWGWQMTIHPQDLPRLMEMWRQLLATLQPGEVEARLKRHDGQYRWFLFRADPFRDQFGKVVKWYGTNTDIDDLKRAQVRLSQEEAEVRRIIDSIAQAIVVMDTEGRCLYANKVLLEYAGLSLDDVQAADFRERVFHTEDIERVRESRRNSITLGIPFENEQRVLGKDGKYRWYLHRYNPFRDAQGRLVRWYTTGTDIHDRKQSEERTRNENVALREEIVRSSLFEEIVGSSEALRRVLVQVSKVAPTDSTVLILGETGTGKELIARAIHNRSKRSTRAFIRVNCAAIPPSLIASELFGHEKGSFTGALQRRLGRFESADGGTLFLDEVGELPPETQVALLRVLQEREFERVGGSQTISVDVRVIAATNRDLKVAVAEKIFREDLYYRLNVFPIRLPALRERADDIPLLVEYLIDRYAQKAGKKIRNISKDTLTLFRSYDWPGNIRELQNVIERAVILCEGETFTVEEAWFTPVISKSTHANFPLVADLVEREKEMIENALRETMGQIAGPTGAAAKLGIPRQTLDSKIRKLGINRYSFKTA
ncbi:MAG: sigma54 specific transcriptional regulator, Fis family [Candidatus Sulfotelmatobacter sp.]|nr:sigma54 specific transcriptional regulator, Fis family [Candidatus Sulfotelmatobacter sp.]